MLSKGSGVARLKLLVPGIYSQVQLGQSIAVNGVCLTVVKKIQQCLEFELMHKTLNYSNLALLRPGDKVNIERALKAGSRIDGHFVSGHIDAIGRVKKKAKQEGDLIMVIGAKPDILAGIVPKGSVALNGVSLTVSAQGSDFFEVSLIPYTLKQTNLGLKKEQDLVNIECDMLGKYARKQPASKQPVSRLNPAFLSEQGFL